MAKRFYDMAAETSQDAVWPVALSLLEDMRSDGVAPSVVTFNAALAACERGGAWEEAECLLVEMEQAGVAPDRIT